MKTPESRARFQAPSRHYHRHRVENPEAAWNQWIGNHPQKRKPSRGIAKALAWGLGFLAFGSVIALMCSQMT